MRKFALTWPDIKASAGDSPGAVKMLRNMAPSTYLSLEQSGILS
jgi:hypothetical protein